ncbi:MAG: restriction endonuclease subunit S [Chitinophagaceae bacterium]|nr:restriction endonuclease subunit S [Chitinophagaceae bacterium]
MEKKLPKDWKCVKLGDICYTTSGGTPSRNNLNYYNGDILWVKSGELAKGVITDTEEKITQEAINNSSAKIFPKGTLLIALYGATIGKLAFLGKEAATNQAVCGIYKNDTIDSHYLYNFLFYKKPKLVQQGIGGAQPNISQTILKQLQIPLPPKPTQQAIVSKIEELFSELDKGIEQLKTAQQQLKTYRQAVLKWAFEGKLTNENVKDGELPEGWKWRNLGDVSEVKRGKSKHRPRDDKQLFGGKYPFIQTGEVRAANGGIITKYNQTYSEFGLQQSKLWSKGTLCLTIAANIAETAFLGFDACFPDSVVGITPDENIFSLKFINYFIQKLKKEIDAKASATAQKNINVDFLENLQIPYCSVEEQNKIVQEIESRLSVADKMEESITQSLQQAEALRQSILKKAFEGRLL